MDQQHYYEQYWQHLRNLGLPEEMIDRYRQQIAQSRHSSNHWATQVGLLAGNLKQFNQLMSGDDADLNDVEEAPLQVIIHPAPAIEPALQWAVACGADVAFVNHYYLNDLSTGLSQEASRSQLSDWWDIHDAAALKEMLHWLQENGHRIEYDIIWQAINLVSIKESKAFLREYIITNELEEAMIMERLRNTRAVKELFHKRKLAGENEAPDMLIWDMARMINLSRIGYDAGYLSREQAVANLLWGVPLLKRTYTSWKHLSLSYQFARCIWNGVELGSVETLLGNMDYLLMAADSPWTRLSFY
ncbi:DUF1266 domain-containing protein [Chitinophaga sp. 30R24]|uniref:DUF1266 domain-containing protein n=1 Tax=Chitinophaga sp. 30R24 TaxID=3248838 RepID=UPI003B92186D